MLHAPTSLPPVRPRPSPTRRPARANPSRSTIGAACLLAGLLAAACSSQTDVTHEESCAVPAPTACPDPAPTYAEVVPILDESCNTCHDPSDPFGEWPLTEYEDLVAWESDVRDHLLACTMPPLDAPPLAPADRLTLMEWVRCGMPE